MFPFSVPPLLHTVAQIVIERSFKLQKNEQVLIITNPELDVGTIATALYEAVILAGGKPVLIFQPVKTQLDFAEPAVIAAFNAKPEIVISLSANKMGKDKKASAHPYRHKGIGYDHIFHLQLYGEKRCRGFWSPGITIDSFCRTVPIDYDVMEHQCAVVKSVLDDAVSIHISAPSGTDVTFGLHGRQAKADDGNFSMPGHGGNLPAGETFISPENGTANGTIVFDGSITLNDGDILIRDPIHCTLDQGFVTEISGGSEATELLRTIEMAETNAYEFERIGTLPPGIASLYARNARAIGEIGIGLNPEAKITGNMLEDEKAFHTCHFAIGHNYDDDLPALIHLDGLVQNPTITTFSKTGEEIMIELDGELLL
ncbi:hypothetical protein FACS1894172_18760 [Spirochaetia bacterium]|nr:hypothetical protein FACS1894164_16510 [Spirochaetia bacterium]GHU36161.1 hypothetical protein FACS1894172_18760 [Spirochaetia bacterium]